MGERVYGHCSVSQCVKEGEGVGAAKFSAKVMAFSDLKAPVDPADSPIRPWGGCEHEQRGGRPML